MNTFMKKRICTILNNQTNCGKVQENGIFTPIKQRDIQTSKLAFNLKISQNSSQTLFLELKGKYPYFGNIAIYSKIIFLQISY